MFLSLQLHVLYSHAQFHLQFNMLHRIACLQPFVILFLVVQSTRKLCSLQAPFMDAVRCPVRLLNCACVSSQSIPVCVRILVHICVRVSIRAQVQGFYLGMGVGSSTLCSIHTMLYKKSNKIHHTTQNSCFQSSQFQFTGHSVQLYNRLPRM